MIKNKKLPYLLLLPSFIFFLIFVYYPFGKTILTSLSVTTETGEFIRFAGLRNWSRVFKSSELMQVLVNTFIMGAIVLTLTMAIAMLFALLSAKEGKGSKLYQLFYALPLVIASAPVAAMWIFIYREDAGLLNSILGTSLAWLRNPDSAMLSLCIVIAWSHIAGCYIHLMVGFRNVPDDLIEAATLDGAGWWRRTLHVMLPMASPQIFFVFFTTIIASFKTFSQIKLMTGGGPAGATDTLMWEVYYRSMVKGQIESACVYALVLFVLLFVITRIQFLFEKKVVFYQ